MKPPSSTTSCTALTQAELSRPPAVKYSVMATPPIDDALPARQAGDHVEHRGAGDQLPGKDGQRADRDQHRDQCRGRLAL